MGFPIRRSPVHSLLEGSPKLIALYNVLHRKHQSRDSLYTLIVTFLHLSFFVHLSVSKLQKIESFVLCGIYFLFFNFLELYDCFFVMCDPEICIQYNILKRTKQNCKFFEFSFFPSYQRTDLPASDLNIKSQCIL